MPLFREVNFYIANVKYKKKKVLKYEQVEIKTWCLPQVALYNLTLPYCKYI